MPKNSIRYNFYFFEVKNIFAFLEQLSLIRLAIHLGLDHNSVAPGKAWKRGTIDYPKPLYVTRRVQVPNRSGLATHRNRVLRGAGVIPPAKRTHEVFKLCDRAAKVTWRSRRGRNSGRQQWRHWMAWCRHSAGVEAHGHVRKGRPGTWEGSAVPCRVMRCGRRVRSCPGLSARVRPTGANGTKHKVAPSEGNEARRDGG